MNGRRKSAADRKDTESGSALRFFLPRCPLCGGIAKMLRKNRIRGGMPANQKIFCRFCRPHGGALYYSGAEILRNCCKGKKKMLL